MEPAKDNFAQYFSNQVSNDRNVQNLAATMAFTRDFDRQDIYFGSPVHIYFGCELSIVNTTQTNTYMQISPRHIKNLSKLLIR
ncbi:hypothetical protein E2986_10858 [Frieseomelitta varia]|uniref:Uncharacterized protein n=1 Tax=Frieseomelitta varia TaxID=561572 RepID=A0A833VV42_9HYME|nr:hypothetical protein E2986_10858 [Frieseomelitta varia]